MMVKKYLLMFILFLLGAFLCTQNASADSGPIQFEGNGVITHDPKGVILKQEDLIINLIEEECGEGEYIHNCNKFNIEAVFLLDNPNEDLSLETYFPLPGMWMTPEEGTGKIIADTFSISLNGQKISDLEGKDLTQIETEDQYLERYSYAFFVELNINKGLNELIVRYTNPVTDTYSGGLEQILYVLKTGSLWEGPIGKLNISVTFPSDFPFERITYSSWPFIRESMKKLTYSEDNVEPTKDITISYVPLKVWQAILPFIDGSEKILTDEQRIEILRLLNDEISNKGYVGYSSNPTLPEKIYERNMLYLVFNGSKDEFVLSQYVDYNTNLLIFAYSETGSCHNGIVYDEYFEEMKIETKKNVDYYVDFIPTDGYLISALENFDREQQLKYQCGDSTMIITDAGTETPPTTTTLSNSDHSLVINAGNEKDRNSSTYSINIYFFSVMVIIVICSVFINCLFFVYLLFKILRKIKNRKISKNVVKKKIDKR